MGEGRRDRPVCAAGLRASGVGPGPAPQRADAEGVLFGTDRFQRARGPDAVDRYRLAVDHRLEARRAVERPAPVVGVWPVDRRRLRDHHRTAPVDQCRHQRGAAPQAHDVESRMRGRRRERGPGQRGPARGGVVTVARSLGERLCIDRPERDVDFIQYMHRGVAQLHYVSTYILESETLMSTKKRGRPGTGINPAVGVRLPPRLLQRLDLWRFNQPNSPGRPEAIRRLIEESLGVATPTGKVSYDVANLRFRNYIKDAARDLLTLSPAQCRSARALLNWSQEELVLNSKITKKTIADLERGATKPRSRTLSQIIAAFEAAGVEFFNGNGPGVRLKDKALWG